MRVTIGNTGAVVDCTEGQTVLAAAVLAGVDYPYTCATGNCAACISTLQSGEVTMLPYSDNALSAAQKAEGKVLGCRAVPVSEHVEVLWLGRGRR